MSDATESTDAALPLPAPDTDAPAPRALAERPPAGAVMAPQGFELAQRMAKALASSSLVPESYRGNIPNCLIALEVAQRTGSSPLAVMQNLYVVKGKPSFSAQFIIGALNACGRFSPLRFEVTGKGDDRGCTAWAMDLATGERIEGPRVSMAMAKAEGWHGKEGSKWKTMPELMLRYRAASFFGRLYAPDLLLGMHSVDERLDIDVDPGTGTVTSVKGRLGLKERLRAARGSEDTP
jgi:hypothetical protein